MATWTATDTVTGLTGSLKVPDPVVITPEVLARAITHAVGQREPVKEDR